MVCLLHLDQWCVFSRVRVTRAFPGIIDFLLSQPSQKGGFYCQNTMFHIILMDGRVSYLLSIGGAPFSDVFPLFDELCS